MHGWVGGTGGLEREGRSELNGEILILGNLYRVIPPPHPTPFFFLSLVCNIELFSKRMNVFLYGLFFFCPFPPIELISEGGGTGWFCISHPQLPHSLILV